MQIIAVTPATPRTDPMIAPLESLSRPKPGAPLISQYNTFWEILPDNHHGQNTKSNTKVDGNSNHSVAERILPLENEIFGEQIDDRSESTGNKRRNEPRSDDSSNTLTTIP